MPIRISNPDAEKLIREFAALAGVGLTEAVILAMRQAIKSHQDVGQAMHTLNAYGIGLPPKPAPKPRRSAKPR